MDGPRLFPCEFQKPQRERERERERQGGGRRKKPALLIGTAIVDLWRVDV